MGTHRLAPHWLLAGAAFLLAMPWAVLAQGDKEFGDEDPERGWQEEYLPDLESSSPTKPSVYLQGQVVLDDGTPAPANVVVERVCGSLTVPEAQTDSKGHFGFRVGENWGGVIGAQYRTGLPGARRPGEEQLAPRWEEGASGQQGLAGCELRAVMPGYRSDTVILDAQIGSDTPDVGTIVLHRQCSAEALTVSATTLYAPKKATRAYNSGLKAAGLAMWDIARRDLLKAVTDYPRFAVAWTALGSVYEALGERVKAREAYGQALAADEKLVPPRLKVAQLAAREGNWPEVLTGAHQVLQLNAHDFPEAHYYASVANYNLGDYVGAEDAARHVIDCGAGERFVEVEQILGMVAAMRGNHPAAIEHLSQYLALRPDAPDAEVVRNRIRGLEEATVSFRPGQ